MPNSNRGRFGRGSGTITVIEEPVLRSYRRKAKVTFWVIWATVGALTATVAASKWPPVIALLAGLAFGMLTGAIAGAIVAAWPVLRAIWWWLPEIILAGALITGWIWLSDNAPLTWRLGLLAVVVGPPIAVKNIRFGLYMFAWCFITRHRIRTCFSEFIITNRTGSLPLILWALPTPVGERVWIWLRPGLSLDDLLGRLDKIAVACWATAATTQAASRSNAAYVRIDLKRRNALTGVVNSPLMELIGSGAPAQPRDAAQIPTALDLPQVTASEVTPARPSRIRRPDSGPPATPALAPIPDDITDWI